MTFDAAFPLKLYLNLTKHDERRRQVENELLDAGIEDYERVPAFPGKWAGSWRGYPTGNRYAQALTHRRAVWTGWRRKAAAVLIFEDDVVLAPRFKEAFAEIELPDDWAIFYFGCQHREHPTIVGPGLVRCGLTWDMHAYAVRASAYREVARALTPLGKRAARLPGSSLHSCDQQVGGLAARLPVYAAWPNLAWQRRSVSEAQDDWVNDNYTTAGRQTSFPEAVAGLDDEMLERFGPASASRSSTGSGRATGRDPFLFCRTRGRAGLGEHLQQLASLRLLAALTGQTVCLWWPEESLDPPGPPEAVLEPTGYRCVSNEHEWRRLTQSATGIEQACPTPSPSGAIVLARQRGLAGGRTDDELVALWRRLAGDLRPSRAVHSRAMVALEGWRATRPLGLHVHRTEHSEADETTRDRLSGLFHGREFDAIFLTCDDPAIEREWCAWLDRQSIRVLGNNRVWRAGHLLRRSTEDAAVDLFLLARCEAVLAAEWSALSWMASVIGNVPYLPAAGPGAVDSTGTG